MRWVTWENVGVDRIGCAWLIRHCIDAEATFELIAEGQPPPEDEAEPFDIPGTRLSHHEGRSSFHTIVREYGLDDPILHRIAQIVDEADVTQEVLVEPAAPGLDLICRGIRLTSPDDRVAIERGHLIYDALYAQLAADPTV
ncbi:MAG: chromate resistance protein [Chloroflexota bacterium]